MSRTTSSPAAERSRAPDRDLPEDLERALEEYLAHLAVERGLSEHTLAAYRRDLTRYAAYLGDRGRAVASGAFAHARVGGG